MNERDQVALLARAALAAGNSASAIAAWRRLVHDDPANPVWRLRLADAHERAGEPDEAWAQRAALADGAFAADRPLHALVAALASGDDVTRRFAPHLAGAALGPPPPPRTQPPSAAPLPEVEPDEALPAYPTRPAGAQRTTLPLLSLFDAEAFGALAPGLSRRALSPGDVLLAEGDRADALYIVVAGSLEVTRSDAAVGAVSLGQVREGGIVGEVALLLDRPRTATVRAAAETELVRIDLAVLRSTMALPAVERALGDHARRRVLQSFLAASTVFRDLDAGARAALLQRFEVKEVPEGCVLVEQGDPGARLSVIAEGQVEVLRAEGDEPACRVAVLGPGDVFGEIALVTGEPATATVVALTDATLLELDAASLEAVSRQHPVLHERLLALTEDRLAENLFIFADDDFFETPD